MRTPQRNLLARLVVAVCALLPAAGVASAQTGYIPYYGKNQIRYDNCDWHTYTTEHFEIYYYPEIEPHLERIAGYAESAYQHVSSELKHDLSMKLPLILFSTASEFWQQNVIPVKYERVPEDQVQEFTQRWDGLLGSKPAAG